MVLLHQIKTWFHPDLAKSMGYRLLLVRSFYHSFSSIANIPFIISKYFRVNRKKVMVGIGDRM